jgi:hypothetical protein
MLHLLHPILLVVRVVAEVDVCEVEDQENVHLQFGYIYIQLSCIVQPSRWVCEPEHQFITVAVMA